MFVPKYKSFLVLILALLLLGFFYYLCQKKGTMDTSMLRAAFPAKAPHTKYDPAKIHFSHEYNFLANTFSPLLEYSASGELVSSVAEKFEWVGNEARFTIRRNFRTVDGDVIDAYDIEKTFKRMFILESNTHGDLKDMLCPGVQFSGLDDVCPGMGVKEGGRVFSMRFNEPKIFLFSMLTAIDFAIIPRKSIDAKTLKIADYRNTSGPYYVRKDDGRGNIELGINKNHFHYSEKIPQNILLVPVDPKNTTEAVKLFEENKIDHIPTFSRVPGEIILDYAAKNSDVSLHSSYPQRLYLLVFTKKGRESLAEDERRFIGVKVKKAVLARLLGKTGYQEADQLFPVLGEGALSKARLLDIESKFQAASKHGKIEKKLIAWNVPAEDIEEIKKSLPNTKFIGNVIKIPGLIDYKKEGLEEPDFWFLRSDTSPQEDISLFSFYLNFEFFHIYGKAGKEWLRGYMATKEKESRLALARELHYQTLYHADVVPIAANSYVAIVRRPWVFDFSKFYATNFIWRIRRN